MKSLFNIAITFFCLGITFGSYAQLTSINPEEEKIVTSALKDELFRSFHQLNDTDMQKPFFIAYTLLWGKEYRCGAKMGTVYYDRFDPNNAGTLRLMVGNYELNDENFNDTESNYNSASAFRQFTTLPQEADYWAIRRYFWQMSDEVYRSANDHYKHKIEAINRKAGNNPNEGLRDFNPSTAVTNIKAPEVIEFDRQKMSSLLKKLSGIFLEDTVFIDSEATFNARNYMTYYYNTEGTVLHHPYTSFSINLSANCFDVNGSTLIESIGFNGLTMNELPGEDELVQACQLIKTRLLNNRIPDTIPEDYSGPVLYEGVSSADYFRKYFFEGTNTLIASREVFSNENRTQAVKQNDSDEQKYNKRIFSKDLTVMDCPSLKNFKGTPLYGYYTMDAEGITPPDTLLLVENGVLKNMLNNRIPTPNQQVPNGHSRFGGLSVNDQVAPGVLVVNAKNGKSKEELRKMLLEEAEDRNLEYAMIVRPLFIGKNYCSNQYFLVKIADQSERLIKEDISDNDSYMKTQTDRLLGFSSTQIVKNDFYSYLQELPVSYIVPDAVLVENGNFRFSSNSQYGMEKRLVPYPTIKKVN
ncbi:MAG: hypothetical protein IPH45_08775 [Bacteroidales bacterium]|nr:hypothetical protein [Bacteroidales bacterium]